MIILAIRTDKPESEVGLFDDGKKLGYETWQAHRQLAETIHSKIKELLDKNEKKLEDLGGMVCFKGPGSFTGLRIGLSVANAAASSLEIPIIGETGEDWVKVGISQLQGGENHKQVIPEYGSPVHITKPKK